MYELHTFNGTVIFFQNNQPRNSFISLPLFVSLVDVTYAVGMGFLNLELDFLGTLPCL